MITYEVKVDASGTKHWYLNGKLHREDGPAVEYANGTKEWWLNDQLHREDGPASEYANGDKHWYLNGKEYTKLKWLKKTYKPKVLVIDNKEVSEYTIKAALKEYFK